MGRAGRAASFLCGGRTRRGGIAAAGASAGTAGPRFAQSAISLVSFALCVMCVWRGKRGWSCIWCSRWSKASSAEIETWKVAPPESTDLFMCNPDLDTKHSIDQWKT
jgi:hypothetical protein